MYRSLSRWLLLVAFAISVSSCDTQGEVNFTVPATGQKNVPTRSIIAVRLSTSMSETDLVNNLDPRHFVVTGDQSNTPYAGTVESADFIDVIPGSTVEEHREAAALNAVADADLEEPVVPLLDTLLFLLEDGTEFKQGEVITVRLENSVRIRSATINDPVTFSFVVGGGSSIAEGALFVTSASPARESATASLSPTIRASLSIPARSETLEAGIKVQGSTTGVHEGPALFEGTATTEVSRRLEGGDAFLPGEIVDVTWNSTIQSADNTPLSPYLLRFQTRAGKVLSTNGWNPAGIAQATGRATALLPGDFDTEVAGAEFVAVYQDRLELYTRLDVGDSWASQTLSLALNGTLRAAFALDVEGDGKLEIYLVTETGDGGEIAMFSVSDAGMLEDEQDVMTFPATGVQSVLIADLNSDGLPELVMTHDDVTFTPEAPLVGGVPVPGFEAVPEQTGHVTFFELQEGLGSGEIDLNNLEALSRLRFGRIDRPIDKFDPASRIDVADLDGDGRLDLVAETADSLVLFRNQSTVSAPFAFRRVGPVLDAAGAEFKPRAWVLGDLDHDFDVDLLAWKSAEALFFENGQPSAGNSATEALGLLFEIVVPETLNLPFDVATGDRLAASNIDGDEAGFVDLVHVAADGAVNLALARPGFRLQFQASDEFFGSGGSSAFAIADINGDTGLDVLVASNSTLRAALSDAALIEAVTPPIPTRFSIAFADDVRGLNGFEDLDDMEVAEDEILVVAIGEITTEFTGYELALDYDESDLSYRGFTIPSTFEGRTGFELCPTFPNLLGCNGFATAKMTFQRSTVGVPPRDADGNAAPAYLGAFRFSRRAVNEETLTAISLTTIPSGDTSFDNAVETREGSLSQRVLVMDVGDPIELTLLPPPPPAPDLLAIACSSEFGIDSFQGNVSWESPRGAIFDSVSITLGEEVLAAEVPWNAGSFSFQGDSGGVLEIRVTINGVEPASANDEDATSRTCGVISIFQPNVFCERRESENVINWELLDHPTVDLFRVYRNGARIATVLGSTDQGGGRYSFSDQQPADGVNFYQVSGVISNIEGPSGQCEVEDQDPCQTNDPSLPSATIVQRTSSEAPNRLRFRWTNGEGYDRLEGRLVFTPAFGGDQEVIFPSLEATETELVYEGDLDRGGAEPGSYAFTLQAFVTAPATNAECGGQEIASSAISFPSIDVSVPSLDDVNFACQRAGLSDISVSWDSLWRGFDRFLTLRVIQDDVVVVDSANQVLVSDTGVSVSDITGMALEPFGDYTVSLTASYQGEEFEVSCGPISFDPLISVGDVEVGVGTSSFEIPILGERVLTGVEGFEFTLDFPDFVTIEGFPAESLGGGRSRISVTRANQAIDPDADGDRMSDGVVQLISLRASIPEDFSLVERSREALTLSGTRMDFTLGADSRDVDASSGRLLVRERYVVVDRTQVDAGSDENVRVAIRTTFTQPPGFDDYKFGAFQLKVRFDPSLIELQPMSVADQASTAIGAIGFWVIPEEPSIVAAANENGQFDIVWVGFNNDQLLFLEPVVNEEIAVMFFRSRVGVDDPAVFASIELVSDPNVENPTAFFPHRDVIGTPVMEAFLPGGVDISSSGVDFGVAGIEPSQGALAGGTVASILGRGFPTDASDITSIRLSAATEEGLSVVNVDPATIEAVSSQEIRFTTPDSGLRAVSFTGARFYDVELETTLGSTLLRRAFLYESPEILSTDVTSVRAGGSDLVRITGRGLSLSATAAFLVDGTEYPVEVFRHDPGGLELVLLATGLPAPAPGEELEASLVVRNLPDPVAIVVREPVFRVLPPTGEVSLNVLALSQQSSTRCGGDVVVITGTGFTPGTTIDLDGAAPENVNYVNASRLELTLPFFAAAANVQINIRESGLVVSEPYEITDPPGFVRGDVDGDLDVDITDATLLASAVVGEGVVPDGQANRDAFDVNDDGLIDFGDSVFLFAHLFEGGALPAAPFPTEGQDPTEDAICE